MSDLLEQLNSEQRAVAEHTEGPVLVLAGAGSGKTRAVTYRIAHLIESHRVPPWSILAVTFTNKAAEQMRERVAGLLAERRRPDGEADGNPWSSGGGIDGRARPQIFTFHALCVRLLRREIEPLGYSRDFAIYDDDDQTRLVKSCLAELGLGDRLFTPRAALSRISYAKNHSISAAEMYQGARDPDTEKLASVYERYQQRLRSANALDFDDLLLKTVELFDRSPELAAAYSGRFRYIHVDEYQDTNRVQYRLIRHLTRAHHNLCVVGDEDQSIYRWRGASIENILSFEKDFREACVLRLERNYRSTQVILDGASAVVSRNRARKGKTLWTERKTGRSIGIYQAADAEEEAGFVAGQVAEALAEPGATVGVLYRTNAQARLLEEAMRARQIGYRLVGGFSFYARAEIRDVLAYARLAVNPRDTAALLRVINTPTRGIGETTLAQLESIARQSQLTLWEALEESLIRARENPSRAARALKGFQQLILGLAEDQKRLGLSEFFSSILERTGYLGMLRAEDSPEAEGRIENLEELVNAAAETEESGEGLTAFLDRAALVADTDQIDERARATLMTLHSAKGLEFSVVLMPGLEEGLLPHKLSLDDDAALEEERRLCYVGMTRAKDRLALSCAATRRSYGEEGRQSTRRSRFLSEIPTEFTETLSGSGRAQIHWQGAFNSRESIERFLQSNGFQERIEQSRPTLRRSSPPENTWRRGSQVRHPKYGVGTILACEGQGEDQKLTVSFPGFGAKKLMSRFATLEKM